MSVFHSTVPAARQLLLFRPTALDGEALCSWLCRIASENGHRTARPLVKLARLNGAIPLSALELSAEMLEWLCNATGCSRQSVLSALTDTVGEALGASPRRAGRRWLLRSSLQQKVGQRFALCQACLTQGTPYWRNAWRFSNVVRCQEHDATLIDRCPVCQSPQLLSLQRSKPLDECEECGESLALTAAEPVGPSRLPCDGRPTWGLPGTIDPQEFPVPVPVEHLFWDGIWTIVSHALLGKVARRLQALNIPPDARSLLAKVAGSFQRSTFEGLPIVDREIMLSFSKWLCEDWPRRFVRVFDEGRVVASTFSGRDVDRPYWIDRVVEDHLNRAIYRPTVAEVESAASWLKSKQREVQPSRIRLKKTLGLTESVQILKVLQAHTRPFGQTDLDHLLLAINDEIGHADTRRSCRDAMQRDAMVIANCMLHGEGLEVTCRLSVAQVQGIWESRDASGLLSSRMWKLIVEWRHEYESNVRPRWSSDGCRTSCYFVTRHGLNYLGFGVPRLITRCLERIGYPGYRRGVSVLRDLRQLSAPACAKAR